MVKKKPSRNRVTFAIIAVAAALGVIGPARAGVVLNPILSTGPGAIDPVTPSPNAGARDATAIVAGAATKAALEGTPGFGVVQTFVGLTAVANLNVNYISFTDPATPDVRITTTSYNGSGGGNSANFTTSGTTGSGNVALNSGQFIGSGGFTAGAASIIEFGTYDATAASFVADRTVSAAGYMISQNTGTAARVWTVKFKDASNNLLSTQVQSTTPSQSVLFGLIADGIARIELGISGSGDAGTFMDDLGFAPTAIPEPSTVLLWCALAPVAAWRVRRSCRLRG
jgi:hypothetical protein